MADDFMCAVKINFAWFITHQYCFSYLTPYALLHNDNSIDKSRLIQSLV